MTLKVPAVYENGVLRLSRRLNLPEHTHVDVQIELRPAGTEPPSDNVLQRLAALAADLGTDDLAEQHDHYLYGTEKRENSDLS